MEIVALTAVQELGINKPNLPTLSKPPLPVLRDDKESQANLAGMLAQCFDGLKLYGKTADQLTNTVKLFRMVLADFPFDKVERAFIKHLQMSDEMPTPASIVSLIQRDGKPPLNKEVYTALSRKKDYSRSHAEDAYMKEYEDFHINGETP